MTDIITLQNDKAFTIWLETLDAALLDWKAADDTLFIGVDLQNDFMPGGTLAVTDGDKTIPVINIVSSRFKNRLWTKESHPANHNFFANNRPGKKPLDTVVTEYGTQYLWPEHCVEGTPGEEFHTDLAINAEDMVAVKGTDPTIHAYSAVYMDDRKTLIRYPDGKTLPEKLREKGIKRIVTGGLAGDFCAGYTAYDLAKEGFQVYYLPQASRSINIPTENGRTTQDIMNDMLTDAKVIVMSIEDLPRLLPARPGQAKQPHLALAA